MSLFHKHQWLKWSGLVASGVDATKWQFRVCDTCGKIQGRNLGRCGYTHAGEANNAIRPTQEEAKK